MAGTSKGTSAAVAAMPVRGRSAEQQVIQSVLHHATGGGRLVIVEGPPGIGKTRFLRWVASTAASDGFAVVAGAAHPLERGRPFAALLDALECRRDHPDARRAEIGRLAGTVAREPDPFTMASEAVGRFAVQDALVDLVVELAERDGPMLLALDDAHCADDATFATLAAIARRLASLPLVAVLAARSFPRTAALDMLIDRSDPPPAALALEPLDATAMMAIASDLLGREPTDGEHDDLARTGGSPLLLSMLLNRAGLPDHAPTPVGDTIHTDARAATLRLVERLPPTTREMLEVAAVVGEPVIPTTLAPLVGRPVGAVIGDVANAVRAGILDERDGILAFRHHLVREALYAEIPESMRIALHRDAWISLAASGAPELVAARHARIGGHPGEPEAISVLRVAAEEVMRTDPVEALELLERAAELAGEGTGAWLDVIADRVRALVFAGRLALAESTARDGLTRAMGHPQESMLQRVLAISLLRQGNFAAAAVAVDAALKAGVDPVEDARLHAELATMRLWAFDGRGADDEAAVALEHATRAGAVDAAMQALNVQSIAAGMRGDVHLGIDLALRSVDLEPAFGNQTRPSPALYLGLALLNADRLREAETVVNRGRRHCESERDPFMESRFAGVQAIVGWLRGDFDHVSESAATIERIAADTGSAAGLPLAPAFAGLVAFHQDDLPAARAALTRARDIAARPEADRSGLPFLALLEAAIAAHDGRWTAASRVLGDLLDLAEAVAPLVPLWIGVDAARAAVAAGDHNRATRTATIIRAIAGRVGTPTATSISLLVDALAHGDAPAIGDAAAAMQQSERAFEAARAAEDAALAMREAGNRVEAARWLAAARRGYEGLGASRDLERITDGMQEESPGPRRARTPGRATGWSSLSPEDHAVAELVVAGLANRDIAEQLFMSKRTVEWHVSRLYTKLNAPNRVALARAIEQHRAK